MSQSPIEQLLAALEGRDVDAVVALFEPDAGFLAVDGGRGKGTDAIRAMVAAYLAALRSSDYRVTAQWHQDNVWIAEVDASYELQDWLELSSVPRAFVVREGQRGISDLHVYGAHEQRLSDHRTGEEGMWVGERWVPPL
ncbi:MAG: nuclear transport factor 2 family protein [Solirubrobacterales bacterium]|nr:nuclear transport factor 2 family protein [Solirubrobacterales bacterium]